MTAERNESGPELKTLEDFEYKRILVFDSVYEILAIIPDFSPLGLPDTSGNRWLINLDRDDEDNLIAITGVTGRGLGGKFKRFTIALSKEDTIYFENSANDTRPVKGIDALELGYQKLQELFKPIIDAREEERKFAIFSLRDDYPSGENPLGDGRY